MEVNEITFCNKTTYNLKNNKEKKNILDSIEKNFNISVTNKNFVFSRKLQNLIKSNKFIMSYITQGNKYFIYLTKFKNENYTLLIDSKVQNDHKLPKILIVQLNFNNELYDNSLFTGQLVLTKSKQWIFLIDDILVYKNKIETDNIITRLSKIDYILNHQFTCDIYLNLFKININSFFNLNEITNICDNLIPKLDYNIYGFTLYPVEKKNKLPQIDILKYKSNNYQKLQPIKQNNNIVKDNQNIFELKKSTLPNIYYLSKPNSTNDLIARIDTIERSEFVKKALGSKNKIIVKCIYCEKFKKWIPTSLVN